MAKTGGLGDVVNGLSYELAIRGNHVEVILPKYDCMRYDRIEDLRVCYEDLWVPFDGQWIHCTVLEGRSEGINFLFIDAHGEWNAFNRGVLYGHRDDAARFTFFSRAALEFLFKSGRRPEIIHCHDWQTGLAPVMYYEIYNGLGWNDARFCYTLHNMGHQGRTGAQLLSQCGLNAHGLMNHGQLLDDQHPHTVNMMKGGIVFSNFITTVSPTYMEEIRFSEQGQGLQGVLNRHGDKVGGVLNGLNYGVWNPELDPFIPSHYGPDNLPAKFANKAALRNRLLMREAFKPIVAVVSRLDPQKGVDLIRHSISVALANNCQFVLLGSASEAWINDEFWRIKHQLNDNPDCHLEIGYDEELSHLIYAGADMLVIPSQYEPCGLTQMIAMKYGVVPVVRSTGGLADTVFDANYADKPFEERNGYVFNDLTHDGLESAMGRAIGLWHRFPDYFRQLRLNGMRQDYSWNQPGQDYINIFNHIRVK
ncbi:putative glycogen/starch synthase, ADP-glucose type [Magnetofaba australis IT-1]|uniref:Glycogen synthase n=1 Tax=Magnetofaba australis IT-1 TaxID=1434232 RepID=A0A1Y2K958_9PROT|nr:putative glycogen/starch synthase, ADP-glucose type [Magnetofaba australis IT-1]